MFQQYYRDPNDLNNDYLNDEVFLQVNCTGREIHKTPMRADSVRRDWYLYYLTEGTVTVTAPVTCVLGAGDCIIFSKNTPFSYADNGPTTHCFLHFTGYAAEELLQKVGLRVNTVFRVRDRGAAAEKFRLLFDAFLCRDALFDTDAVSALVALLVTLGRVSRPEEEGGRLSGRRLQKSIRYIHDHMSEQIRVKTLADMEYLSESRYRSLFVALIGQPPLEYQLRLRMRTACRLLENSDMTIQQIGAAVGYTDQRYFSRLFQKRMGMTPGGYRKRI